MDKIFHKYGNCFHETFTIQQELINCFSKNMFFSLKIKHFHGMLPTEKMGGENFIGPWRTLNCNVH